MSIDTFDLVLREQIAQCTGLPNTQYEAEIDLGGYKINVMAVVSVTQRNLYMTDMFEEFMLTVAMQPSEYSEGVLVAHEDIRIKLTERPWGGGKGYSKKYRAVLVDVKDERMEANRADIGEVGIQDQMSISIITFQLMSEACYDLRLREYDIIANNATAADVLRGCLSKVKLTDSYSASEAIAKIKVDDLASDKVYRDLVIPEGTEWLAVPDYLQNNYGIFPNGLGCFLKGQTWYVFSPFGLAKQNKDVNRLNVFAAPSARNRTLERNFMVEGKTITVIATGESRHFKNSDAESLNEGTGIRYASLDALDGGVSTKDPAANPVRTPQDYMTEYRASNYASPYQKTKTATERFVGNPLKHSSDLSRRGGDVITVQWENGTLDPLEPGMPVKFNYGSMGKIITRYGTLISAEKLSSIAQGGIIEAKHQATVSLTLWLKRS